MSSRSLDECVDLAHDESASEQDRVEAIHRLKTANECSELESLVRSDDLADDFRRHALEALATPQCAATLHELIEAGDLEESLRGEAETLHRDLDDEELDTPGDVFES